jgi:hypothetical protein
VLEKPDSRGFVNAAVTVELGEIHMSGWVVDPDILVR